MLHKKSTWAWGWQDKFPDEASRAGLAQLARVLLPSASPVLRALPSEVVVVPAPRAAIPDALAAFATDDPEARALRTRGRAFLDLAAGFAGDFRGAPDVVAMPRSNAEVLAVLETCAARGWACVPFGGGTSVVGGVDATLARGGGDRVVVSLDLSALAGVRELDETSRLARIGAGTFGPALEDELGARGYTLRHFPQSFEFSTLGGWLATRAGGHYATGPTHIDDHCHALTMITPRGTIATHGHPASGAGPEPLRLILGSEGALGVIAEATMRVVPAPSHRASASVAFGGFEAGVACARALAQSGLQPANARLLDPDEARMHRVRFDGSAVLLVAFESADHPVDASLARALELARDHGGDVTIGRSSSNAQSWRQAFFDAPYLQSALLSVGVLSDTFETACTWTQFPALHARVTAAVRTALAAECGGGLVACRFTHVYPDGPAPYYTFVGAARDGDVSAQLAQWRAIKTAATDALASARGTITHHHGIGRMHVPWYRAEVSPLFGEALAAVKRTLDPHNTCNPGTVSTKTT
ncbi:MAG TPA: FAD-binding oxidoreductase [Kofleriaceae bacterium]|nr:FAD-binding oxidoreductase [Kofleriaceae bacterium]